MPYSSCGRKGMPIEPQQQAADLGIFGGRGGGHGPWARVGGLPPGVLAPRDQESAISFHFSIVDIKTSFRSPAVQHRAVDIL